MSLKHMLGTMCLICALAMPAGAATTAQDITGQQWAHSTKAEKLSFLYGASSVVAIEKVAAERAGKEPSPFVTRWMDAFGGKTLSQIEGEIDAWYVAHPRNRNRHVFDVIWYELITPAGAK